MEPITLGIMTATALGSFFSLVGALAASDKPNN